MKRFQIALSKKTTGIFENIHAKKSGEAVYTETHATTMIEDGKIVGGVGREIDDKISPVALSTEMSHFLMLSEFQKAMKYILLKDSIR